MFPNNRVNERTFAAGWSGEVVVCDIDRTYLATRFSTLKGLARIPFEFAVDKQDIDGIVVLLREVRRGPAPESRSTPLYFISASPAQLRPVIQRKMLLDFAPHLLACRGALQIALGLWEQRSISQEGVTRVAEDLAGRGWSDETLGDRLRDACRRGLLGPRPDAPAPRGATPTLIPPRLPSLSARWSEWRRGEG
jgi:hypothetical protein